MGTLSIVIESIKVGNDPVNDSAQFNLNVTPEFPVLPVVMSAGLVGSVIASRFFFFRKKD